MRREHRLATKCPIWVLGLTHNEMHILWNHYPDFLLGNFPYIPLGIYQPESQHPHYRSHWEIPSPYPWPDTPPVTFNPRQKFMQASPRSAQLSYIKTSSSQVNCFIDKCRNRVTSFDAKHLFEHNNDNKLNSLIRNMTSKERWNIQIWKYKRWLWLYNCNKHTLSFFQLQLSAVRSRQFAFLRGTNPNLAAPSNTLMNHLEKVNDSANRLLSHSP